MQHTGLTGNSVPWCEYGELTRTVFMGKWSRKRHFQATCLHSSPCGEPNLSGTEFLATPAAKWAHRLHQQPPPSHVPIYFWVMITNWLWPSVHMCVHSGFDLLRQSPGPNFINTNIVYHFPSEQQWAHSLWQMVHLTWYCGWYPYSCQHNFVCA